MLKKKNVKLLMLAFLLFLTISKIIYNNHLEYINTKAVDDYYSYNSYKNECIAILEIPNISLKECLYNKDSKKNDVKYNIQILDESIMPDQDNSTTFLAAHSGNSSVSYFNDLENLNIDDQILFYYKNKKYTYKITNYYYEKKTGFISVSKGNNMLILTTCSQQKKGYQFIIIANLFNIDY